MGHEHVLSNGHVINWDAQFSEAFQESVGSVNSGVEDTFSDTGDHWGSHGTEAHRS